MGHASILFSIVLSLAFTACGNGFTSTAQSKRVDAAEPDLTPTIPADVEGFSTQAQEGIELIRLPGTVRTGCFVHLETAFPAGSKALCRGVLLPNWQQDSEPLSNLSAARCVQRAAEWSHYCGTIRTSTFFFGQLSNGVWYPFLSSRVPGKYVAGTYYRPRNVYEYRIAD